MGDALPIYHINRMVEETGKKFQDEAHIIYVNGAYRDESPLGILMHDFSCTVRIQMISHMKFLQSE